MPSYYLK
jgi:hypothetical protein